MLKLVFDISKTDVGTIFGRLERVAPIVDVKYVQQTIVIISCRVSHTDSVINALAELGLPYDIDNGSGDIYASTGISRYLSPKQIYENASQNTLNNDDDRDDGINDDDDDDADGDDSDDADDNIDTDDGNGTENNSNAAGGIDGVSSDSHNLNNLSCSEETRYFLKNMIAYPNFEKVLNSLTNEGPITYVEAIQEQTCLMDEYRKQLQQLARIANQMENEARHCGKLSSEIEKLKNLIHSGDGMITNMAFIHKTLYFLTKPVTAEYNGKHYKLGRFFVRLPVFEPWLIKIINVDHRVVSNFVLDTPHVINGTPCFGNAAETFFRATSNMDLDAALNILFAFLRSVNPDDQNSIYISLWPLQTEEAK